jgi:hypothetical protein
MIVDENGFFRIHVFGFIIIHADVNDFIEHAARQVKSVECFIQIESVFGNEYGFDALVVAMVNVTNGVGIDFIIHNKRVVEIDVNLAVVIVDSVAIVKTTIEYDGVIIDQNGDVFVHGIKQGEQREVYADLSVKPHRTCLPYCEFE